jgi:soluble lytic murein transglycosylase-like protein
VRGLFAVLLATAAAAGLTVAVAQERDDDANPPPAPRQTPEAQPLPAPNSALPRSPARLAARLTATTRWLRDALGRWDPAGEVPRDVTYLALHHQRILRLMGVRRGLGDATLARLPRDVRGEARETMLGRRHLAAIPRSPGRLPRVRVAEAAPAAELRRHYAAAQRRFGVHWSILASINFVESAFGRVRSASEAGARGPMQFLPSTWREYGMGGNIEDPRDAILAAANYLRRAGAPVDMDRALFAYNHSTSYVRAIRRFAHRMRVDPRTFLSYYAWQVFVRTPTGVRRLTGPGRD